MLRPLKLPLKSSFLFFFFCHWHDLSNWFHWFYTDSHTRERKYIKHPPPPPPFCEEKNFAIVRTLLFFFSSITFLSRSSSGDSVDIANRTSERRSVLQNRSQWRALCLILPGAQFQAVRTVCRAGVYLFLFRDRGHSDLPRDSVRDLGLRVLKASYRQLLGERASIAGKILDGCDFKKFFHFWFF